MTHICSGSNLYIVFLKLDNGITSFDSLPQKLNLLHKTFTWVSSSSTVSSTIFYDHCLFCSSRETDLPSCFFCRLVQEPSFLYPTETFSLSLGYGLPRTQSPCIHLLKRFQLSLQNWLLCSPPPLRHFPVLSCVVAKGSFLLVSARYYLFLILWVWEVKVAFLLFYR